MSFGGYTRVPEATLDNLCLVGNRVAVQEDLAEKVTASGLAVLSKQATTVGRVLAVGSGVVEDLAVGDLVVYEQWQGGRWLLGDDTKCLIMDADKVLLVVAEYL